MACKFFDKQTQQYMRDNPFMKGGNLKDVYNDITKFFKVRYGSDSMIHATVKENIGMFWLQKTSKNPIFKQAWKIATGLRDTANLLTRQDKSGFRFDEDIVKVRNLSEEMKKAFSDVSIKIEEALFSQEGLTGSSVTAQFERLLSGYAAPVKEAYYSARRVLDLRFLDMIKSLVDINAIDNRKGTKEVRFTAEQQAAMDALETEYAQYRTKDKRWKKNVPPDVRDSFSIEETKIKEQTQSIEALLAEDYKRVHEGGRVEDSLLIDIYRQLGYKSGYIPHKRNGRYFAVVRNEKGETIYKEHFDIWRESVELPDKVKQIAEQLGVKESDIETGVNVEYEPDVQDIRAVRSVLQDPKLRSKLNLTEDQIRRVVNEFAEMQKQGFGKHFRRRVADKYIGGFDTDIVQSINDYVYGSANALAKIEYRQKQVDLVTDMANPDGGITQEQRYIKRYLEEQFRQSTKADMAVQKVSSAGYYINFSMRPVYGIFNLAGHYINLASQRLHSRSSIIESQKVMLKMFGEYSNYTGNDKFRQMVDGFKDHKYAKEIKDVLDWAIATGRLDENFLEDFDVKRAEMSVMLKFASWIPVKSEKITRMSAFITGVIDAKAKNPNATFEEMYDLASELDYTVNYARGRANRASFEMGGGVASSLARIGTMYTSYTRNQLAMLGFMMKDKNYAGLGIFSIVSLAAGGLMGSPLTGNVLKLLQQLTGDDYENQLKASDNMLAQVLGGGIAYPFGADVSGQLTAQMPFLTEPYIVSVFKNSHMKEYFEKGGADNWLKAFESGFLTPVQVKNVLRAIRLSTTGDTTREGRLIVDENGEPIKTDTTGAILYSLFGIRPADYSQAKARQYLSQGMSQLYAKRKRDARTKYLFAEDGDSSEIDALNEEIRIINEALGLDIAETDTDVDPEYSINLADVSDDSYLLWFGY